MPFGLELRIRDQLKDIDQQGLWRRLVVPSGIDLCSNDYLGLARHPYLKERMTEAIITEGCGATGSRLLRGQREAFMQLEVKFAKFKGTEASLYFSSGYTANIGALTAVIEPDDVVFSDELNHASIIDGLRLTRANCVIFPHCNVDAVKGLIAKEVGHGQIFLVTESLFSMDGDIPPLSEYAKLCREYDAALIVDEAHAVGIYGDQGTGLIEETGIGADVFLSINTAGKALGVSGAFAAGPQWLIDYLIQKARPFIFSTASPPAIAAAVEGALELVEREPERRTRLRHRAEFLRNLLEGEGIVLPPGSSQIVPLILGENDRALMVAAYLKGEGFDVRAIRPPTVEPGTARLRISVTLNVGEADLRGFSVRLANALKKFPN